MAGLRENCCALTPVNVSLRRRIPIWIYSYRRWVQKNRRYPGLRRPRSARIGANCVLEGPTIVHADALVSGSSVGRYTYLCEVCRVYKTRIGRLCSSADGVVIGGGVHPRRDCVFTSPVFLSAPPQAGDPFVGTNQFLEVPETTVGNDVWIGTRAIVLPGVKIADGATVGAGTVVSRDVSAYQIVGGVPARTIRTRFGQEDINVLLATCWWEWPESPLQELATCFQRVESAAQRCIGRSLLRMVLWKRYRLLRLGISTRQE